MLRQSLVILPGWGGSRETWSNFANLAKEKFSEVKIFNLPCFGDEPCPKDVWGVGEYADFVKSKIINNHKSEIRNLSRAPHPALCGAGRDPKSEIILLGHSFGGAVAVHLIANNPNLASGLILSGASVFRPKQTMRRLFFRCLAKCGQWIFKLPLIKKFEEAAKKLLYRVAGSSDYSKISGIKREIFKKIITEDQSRLLPKIQIPTLIVCGSKDRFVPLEYGKKIQRLLPGSKLVIFQGGKHGLHLQQPEELLNTIINFIE
ncbi:MAG: alpha/beta hydrolase [Patescibacteria group bacterium]